MVYGAGVPPGTACPHVPSAGGNLVPLAPAPQPAQLARGFSGKYGTGDVPPTPAVWATHLLHCFYMETWGSCTVRGTGSSVPALESSSCPQGSLLPREDAPSLEAFRTRLDEALSNLVWVGSIPAHGGGWNQMGFEAPSNQPTPIPSFRDSVPSATSTQQRHLHANITASGKSLPINASLTATRSAFMRTFSHPLDNNVRLT